MPPPTQRPAVFLDRDGVIIENRDDYVKSLAEVRFIPGALEALAGLAGLDVLVVIVTNQSAIGRGLVAEARSAAINRHVVEHIVAAGGRVDGLYVCPHHPDERCACRKPAPGLLLQAAAALSIDLGASVMIGDAVSDVLAGQAAGTRAILVRTGRGAQQAAQLARLAPDAPVPVVADLAAAVAEARASLRLSTKTPPEMGA